jgi:hypothetical protein
VTSSIYRAAFPTRPPELTADWLTTTLQNAGVIGAGSTITDWDTTDIGSGIGFMGDIVRLSLRYANSPASCRSVVAKFSTQSVENRAVAAGFTMYEREVKFYRELVPLFADVAPECYFVDYNPATNDMILLFEDLCDYRAGDQTVGMALDDARLAIGAVARLHAKTWHADTRAEFDSWPRVDGPIYLQGLGGGVAAGLNHALETFSYAVPTEVVAAADRIRDGIPYLHAKMATGPQALIHGDFRLDNFMFGQSPGQRSFVMLDFQAPIVTKAVHDVAYLLSQSLSIDDRRAEERNLVADYHRLLVEYGATGYSADECWNDYRLAVLHAFEFAVVIAGTLDPTNERGKLWIGESVRRACQTIVDLDLLDLLP